MWSFGCILAELSTGRALFPAVDENELLEFFQLMLAPMPEHMKKRAKKQRKFYNRFGNLIPSAKSRIQSLHDEKGTSLPEALYSDDDPEFLDFVSRCLELEPEKRMSPEDALRHPWLTRNKTKA